MPRATQDTGRLRKASRTGLSPSAAALSSALPLAFSLATARSYNPAEASTPAVWANPRSLATTGGITFCSLFLQVLRCFSSLRSPPRLLPRVTALHAAGLPHSDTRGSRAACASPRIFAACRVLHRLAEPRHPPMRPYLFPPRPRLHQNGGRIPRTRQIKRARACSCSFRYAVRASCPHVILSFLSLCNMSMT